MYKRAATIALFGIITGIAGSLATVMFIELVELGNRLLFVNRDDRSLTEGFGPMLILVIMIPALGGLVVGLLTRSCGHTRPLNLSDTIESAHTHRFDIPTKKGLITALSSVISLGSGASVGQYGPLAHLGSTLGLQISRYSRATGFTPTMGIGCGVAAAIATAFNAPIAGLVFAHEVILRHYSLRSFAPIAVAAATGHLFEDHVFRSPALFEIEIGDVIHAPEYFVFLLIGIIGAYVAYVFVRATVWATNRAQGLPIPGFLKPALAGAVVGVVAIWVPEVLGIGEQVIHDSLAGNRYGALDLTTILIAKITMTALCLGFGFAGGVFSPALVIGVLFGALVGSFSEPLLGAQFSTVVVYAVCGMMAVTSPVIGAPLTAILIVFELTHNYELTIAAMISVVFANLAGYQLMGRSIYDKQLRDRGFDLSLGRDKVVMNSRDISALVSQEFVSVQLGESLSTLKGRLLDAGQVEGLVLGENGDYQGTVSLVLLGRLERDGADMGQECANHAVPDPVVLNVSTTIWEAMEQVCDFVGESIPVIDGEGSLLGVVFEASIIQGYVDALHEIRQEEHGAS